MIAWAVMQVHEQEQEWIYRLLPQSIMMHLALNCVHIPKGDIFVWEIILVSCNFVRKVFNCSLCTFWSLDCMYWVMSRARCKISPPRKEGPFLATNCAVSLMISTCSVVKPSGVLTYIALILSRLELICLFFFCHFLLICTPSSQRLFQWLSMQGGCHEQAVASGWQVELNEFRA